MVAPNAPYDREICAVCGRDTAGGRSFMRVYVERGRLEFCTPVCAMRFNASTEPVDFGGGQRVPERGGWQAWTVRWSR